MPKINIVDFNEHPKESEPIDTSKTEAEELTMIQDEIKAEPIKTPKKKKPTKAVEQATTEPVAEAPKRKPTQNVVEKVPTVVKVERVEEPAAEESTVEEAVLEDPVIEPPKPEPEVTPEVKDNKKVRVTELHKCPDCGKEMTKKSLRYSHAQNCTAKKTQVEQPKVKQTLVKIHTPNQTTKEYVIPEEVIQQEILKRADNIKVARIQRKQENIKKLAQQIA